MRLHRRVVRRIEQEIFTRRVAREMAGCTMLSRERLSALVRQVDWVNEWGVPGAFVECGVWRGGASFTIARRLGRRWGRQDKVWMFDSFEGLPAPTPIDGERAWGLHDDPTWYLDNNRASLDEVLAGAARRGLSDRVQPVKGWFDRTLPARRGEIGAIAFLRLDGDWYESIRACLDNLYDQVSPGGLVAVDDYYDYEGCSIAVHEFLAEHRLPHRLVTTGGTAGTAYFRKQ